ncbi:MAG TPA: hypothetical protein VF102_04420 [Gemmatimonadaceae bacterium]
MTEKRRCCLCASKIIARTIALPTGEKLLVCPMHNAVTDDVILRAYEAGQRTTKRKVTA